MTGGGVQCGCYCFGGLGRREWNTLRMELGWWGVDTDTFWIERGWGAFGWSWGGGGGDTDTFKTEWCWGWGYFSDGTEGGTDTLTMEFFLGVGGGWGIPFRWN